MRNGVIRFLICYCLSPMIALHDVRIHIRMGVNHNPHAVSSTGTPPYRHLTFPAYAHTSTRTLVGGIYSIPVNEPLLSSCSNNSKLPHIAQLIYFPYGSFARSGQQESIHRIRRQATTTMWMYTCAPSDTLCINEEYGREKFFVTTRRKRQ